jgi:hypothetical protein
MFAAGKQTKGGGMKRALTLFVWMMAAMATGMVFAEQPGNELVPVTDPEIMASYGVDPLGPPLMVPARLLDGDQHPVEPTHRSERAKQWGVDNMTSTSVTGNMFNGSEDAFIRDGGASGQLWCGGGTSFADAQFDLPAGASIEFFDVWGYDTNASENLTVFLFRYCLPDLAQGFPVAAVLRAVSSTGTGGNFFTQDPISADAITNVICTYVARARFDSDGAGCVPNNSLRLYKVRLQWKRQVSPAPPASTFNDVPTNHPFFQHVEALFTSGITAGCGGGSFCPDDPLTRGQMAVFLSKALGLQWENFR